MKVLHVINSLTSGGAEKLVSILANVQSKQCEVSVFCFNTINDIFSERLSEKVNYYKNAGKNFLNLNKLFRLCYLIKKHDVIHVHLFPSLYIVAIISIFFKDKLFIYTEHSTSNKRRKPYLLFIEKFIYSRYRKIICISIGVETALLEWIKGDLSTVVINNAIYFDEINRAKPLSKSAINLPDDSKLIVMVGRYCKPKDQYTLIRTLRLLPSNFFLILIGGGDASDLIRYSDELNVKNRLVVLGRRNDVYSILKICDYGILASKWEGFGIAALEYMACDLISIGSNVAGLNEVIPCEDCLFENEDYLALSNIIMKFDSDHVLSNNVKNIQNNHLLNYDIENSAFKHFEVYNSNLT